MTPSVFLHIDVNNFYAACHAVFSPALQKKPLMILSANDGNIIACSPSAKLLGFKRGTPLFDLQKWIEPFSITVLSAVFPLYADMSRRILETLAQFSSDVEFYSIDEMFAQVPWTSAEEIGNLASRVRDTIFLWTGLVVSIGIGPSKTISKLATRLAKSREAGIVDLASDPFQRDALLRRIPVKELWGIGARSAHTLHLAGVYSAHQLISLPDWHIRSLLRVPGQRLVWELRGYSVLPLEYAPPSPKSISRMRTFGEPITQLQDLQEALTTFLTRAAEKLRRHRLAASALTVFLSTGTFHRPDMVREYARVCALPAPTSSTCLLAQAAREGARQLFSPGIAYRRAGIHLLGLVPADPQQQALFFSSERLALEQRLALTVDLINSRFGRDTLYFGGHNPQRSWQKHAYPSPQATTNWREIPVVQSS